MFDSLLCWIAERCQCNSLHINDARDYGRMTWMEVDNHVYILTIYISNTINYSFLEFNTCEGLNHIRIYIDKQPMGSSLHERIPAFTFDLSDPACMSQLNEFISYRLWIGALADKPGLCIESRPGYSPLLWVSPNMWC